MIFPRHCTRRDNRDNICNCGCEAYEKEIKELEEEEVSLRTEARIATSDGRIYAGVARIQNLRDALTGTIPFDNAVKNVVCWCSDASDECVTPMCIRARDALIAGKKKDKA